MGAIAALGIVGAATSANAATTHTTTTASHSSSGILHMVTPGTGASPKLEPNGCCHNSSCC